jgi:hypothetical protein
MNLALQFWSKLLGVRNIKTSEEEGQRPRSLL